MTTVNPPQRLLVKRSLERANPQQTKILKNLAANQKRPENNEIANHEPE
jgi:hypothetical protein